MTGPKYRKRLVAAAILTTFLIGSYLALPGILNAAALMLILERPAVGADRADVIISLGGNNYCRRESRAAELYKMRLAGNLIISTTEYGSGFECTQGIKTFLSGEGVPESAVQMCFEGTNTRIEAEKITAMMRERGWRTAIIVTSAYHSRRATYTFQRASPEMVFYSMPSGFAPGDWQPEAWWKRRGDSWRTIREMVAWGNTLLNGWK